MTAVPGCGKTHMLTEFIKNVKCPPENICAITFTNEAADEMRSRISKEVTVSTIHSLANKINLDKTCNFDYMLINATKILSKKRLKYKVIAIDEAQDLDNLQYEFLLQLCRKADEVFIVGDPMQSIYGFNNSNPEFMTKLSESLKSMAATSILDKVEINTSYRLPKEITSSLNKFAGTNILPNAEKGFYKLHVTSYEDRYNYLNSILEEEPATLLFRTNDEILEAIQSIGQKKCSYSQTLSKAPLVELSYLIYNKDNSFNKDTLFTSMKILGYYNAKLRKDLNHIKNSNLNFNYLKSMFHDKNLVFSSGTQDLLMNFIDAIDCLQIEDKSGPGILRELQIMGFKDTIGWEHKTDNLIVALERRIQLNEDTYYIKKGGYLHLSTMHGAKGREWDNVYVLVNPFINIYDSEELRVLYVAMSRAKRKLNVILPIEDLNYDNSTGNILERMLLTSGRPMML